MNKHNFNSRYTRNILTNVWSSSSYKDISYSDGEDIESRILKIVAKAKDLSSLSVELRSHITDWPSHYHLSPLRSNLLRPIQDQLTGRILEIGAGCGAITRFLGETGAEVLAIEGTMARAKIAASRCRDLPNVSILAEAFDTFTSTQKYDVITLIGVLEYARLYFPGENQDPVDAMLTYARTFLAPGGILVVAIENQLGLKYLAGFPEDHVGISMFGVEDQYSSSSVVTFGKKELGNRLSKSGFPYQKWWFPFPDYKTPHTIISESFVELATTVNLAPIFANSTLDDYQNTNRHLFSIEKAWAVISRNGLLGDVANSFLVVASSKFISPEIKNVICYHFAVERRKSFAKQAVFIQSPSGNITVENNLLALLDHFPDETPIILESVSENFIDGQHWHYALINILNKNGWAISELHAWAKIWLDCATRHIFPEQCVITDLKKDTKISGNFFDAVPKNLIVTEMEGRFFDQEWRLSYEIEFGFLIFRAIAYSLTAITTVAIPKDETSIRLIDLFKRIANKLGFWITESDIERYLSFDADITEWATGRRTTLSAQQFGELTFSIRDPLFKPAWHARLNSLSAAILDAETTTHSLNQTLAKRDEQLAILSQVTSKRDEQLAQLNQVVSERDEQLAKLNRHVSERDEQLLALQETAAECDRIAAERSEQLATYAQALADTRTSASWRITRPLRLIGRHLLSIARQTQIAKKALQLGGGLARTTILAFKVLRKEGMHGIAWRLKNASKLIERERGKPINFFNTDEFSTPIVVNTEGENGELYIPLTNSLPLQNKSVKIICFYLPQFHAIPENDNWWGMGFTEWANVQPAQPQFHGHYQPHIPGELGYYNLLDSHVQRRQVDLAKLYGIGGFCFYFYWFGGKRLLEAPVQNYLRDAKLDLPFCLCWANENWSRRWDGLDHEILIQQQHSDHDDLAFIEHIAQYMSDDRYIKINGKPLLLVYRPSLLPSAIKSADRWREWCRHNGIGEIYLAYTQSFETVDPAHYGFDAAIEFPPNNSSPPDISKSVYKLDKTSGCVIYDWRIFVERSRNYKNPGYKLFRSVCPSWDNTARRKQQGTIFLNSTPALYKEWLINAIRDTHRNNKDKDDHLVFVNAWNEWAEGAHLEPDARYGYAWLQATRDALIKAKSSNEASRKIIVVSHDAHPHGAQYLALHLAKTLSSSFGFEVDIVLLGEGVLKTEFSKIATVHDLSGKDPRGNEATSLAKAFAASGHQAAIVNTTVSGLFLESLSLARIRCIALVHELKGVITENNLYEHVSKISTHAAAIVFPAEQVANSFREISGLLNDKKVIIRHQGLYKRNTFCGQNDIARKMLRDALGLSADTKVVLGVGYADHRKGIDIFVEIGIAIAKQHRNIFFVWVGHWDTRMQPLVEQRLIESQMQQRILFVGRKENTDMYYAGADVYALTSREDPFPSVVMESLEVSVPVVGFNGAGGFDVLISKGCGILVEKENVTEFSKAILEIVCNQEKACELGLNGFRLIEELFSFRHYIFDLLDLAQMKLKRVSAIIPNYNYSSYLDQRFESILNQTYPIYEIIVLDDASADDSINVINNNIKKSHIDCLLIANKKNSGSVFKQWETGVEKARGEYIWICEADDFAESRFLESTINQFSDSEVVMTYTQSKQVDENGNILSDNYLNYTNDISTSKWQKNHLSNGMEELRNSFTIKNVVPNVSAVIFRKSSLQKAITAAGDYRFRLKIAGDWLIYANVLAQGNVYFAAESLNSHRRHNASVTKSSSSNASHLAEIIFMQEYVASASNPTQDIRTSAKNYAMKIYKQFDLDPCHLDCPVENKDIQQTLDLLRKKSDA